MSIITIKNLSYQYPISESDALKNVNVTIERGKLYALIGANGGGKTTLCNVIRGFIPHFYKGRSARRGADRRQGYPRMGNGRALPKIGYVFQNPFTQISGVKDNVFEEIAFGLENLGMEPARIREKVDQVINMLEIGYLRDKTRSSSPAARSSGLRSPPSSSWSRMCSLLTSRPRSLIRRERKKCSRLSS